MELVSNIEGVHNYKVVSLEEFQKNTEELARRVAEKAEPELDVLLFVREGALYMRDFFVDEFTRVTRQKPEIKYIKARSYHGVYDRVGVELSEEPELTSGLCVGVIDDVCDQGDTLFKVKNYLQGKGCDMFSGTIYLKPWSKFNPDVYFKKTKSWVIFPREKHEMLKIIRDGIRHSKSELEREYLKSVIVEVEKLPDIVPL